MLRQVRPTYKAVAISMRHGGHYQAQQHETACHACQRNHDSLVRPRNAVWTLVQLVKEGLCQPILYKALQKPIVSPCYALLRGNVEAAFPALEHESNGCPFVTCNTQAIDPAMLTDLPTEACCPTCAQKSCSCYRKERGASASTYEDLCQGSQQARRHSKKPFNILKAFICFHEGSPSLPTVFDV